MFFDSAYSILKFARLGDAIVNYVFSVCATLILKEPVGIRARNIVLRKVFLKYKIKERFGIKKLPRNIKPEDFVEALIAILWVEEKIDVEELIKYIVSDIDNIIYDDIEYIVADRMIKYILSKNKLPSTKSSGLGV